ncbi:DUF4434 domain-containing protein, partial [Escherichia sp. TWPC-MK]
NAQRLISDVSAKPVYISSFFAGNMSPDGYRQLLEHVKATGVNVWVQDGSGVDKLTAEQRGDLCVRFRFRCKGFAFAGDKQFI